MAKKSFRSFREYERYKRKLVQIILVLKRKLAELEEEYKNLSFADEEQLNAETENTAFPVPGSP